MTDHFLPMSMEYEMKWSIWNTHDVVRHLNRVLLNKEYRRIWLYRHHIRAGHIWWISVPLLYFYNQIPPLRKYFHRCLLLAGLYGLGVRFGVWWKISRGCSRFVNYLKGGGGGWPRSMSLVSQNQILSWLLIWYAFHNMTNQAPSTLKSISSTYAAPELLLRWRFYGVFISGISSRRKFQSGWRAGQRRKIRTECR